MNDQCINFEQTRTEQIMNKWLTKDNEWQMNEEWMMNIKKNNDKNDKQPNGWTMTSNERSELNAWWNIMNNLWVSDKIFPVVSDHGRLTVTPAVRKKCLSDADWYNQLSWVLLGLRTKEKKKSQDSTAKLVLILL